MAAAKDAKEKARLEKEAAAATAKAARDEKLRAAAEAGEKAKLDKAARAEAEKASRADKAKAAAEAKEKARQEKAERVAAAQEAKASKRHGGGDSGGGSAPDSGRLSASESPRKVTEVGFKQMPEVSRIFVRTNDKARYNISEAGEKVIILELENTKVKRKNDQRFMDTSFFSSSVAMVTPRKQGGNYVIEIKLK
jgi:hypothetical protein